MIFTEMIYLYKKKRFLEERTQRMNTNKESSHTESFRISSKKNFNVNVIQKK